jgi:hypothetical protein
MRAMPSAIGWSDQSVSRVGSLLQQGLDLLLEPGKLLPQGDPDLLEINPGGLLNRRSWVRLPPPRGR